MRRKWTESGMLLLLCCLSMLLCARPASMAYERAAEVKGQITDVEGRPVAGARVFAYDGAEVRRQANFISAPSDNNGSFRMVLMPGRYWLTARLKKGEEYGPLMPGDKHSGEPVVLDIFAGREANIDFTVADLKDARKVHAKDRERPVKISGRIIDEKGVPIQKAYAIAVTGGSAYEVPEYLSSWVDAEGRYSLFLPRGKYSLGCAFSFPPGRDYFLYKEITVTVDLSGQDIIMKPRGSKIGR